MARTPYVTVRGPEPPLPAPKPQETKMPTEYERRDISGAVPAPPVPQEIEQAEEEDPKPERQVIPLDDLDRIEKLLDVSVQTVDMPNLAAIKQACMEELAQINAAVAESQTQANEQYTRELAEWESKKQQKAEEKRKRAEEEEKKDAS